MARADDFLENRTSESLIGLNTSSVTGHSEQNKNFINQNKSGAFDRNANVKLNRNKDRLPLSSQERYDELLKGIDASLEDILKDKEVYYKNLGNDIES